VISGPSTSTQSVAKTLFGVASGTAGAAIVADTGKCLTDSFSITNQQNLPVICGVNSGYHVYFDASDDCHSLNFQLGNVATGIASIATRTWSIKVTQYSCDYENLAPNGCDQWHFGSDASNYVQTFNFQSGTGVGRHLANQEQQICIRRETGMCRICYSVDNVATDIGIGGKSDGKAGVKGTVCCGYGVDGLAGVGAIGGGDCIIIPGAEKADDAAQVAQQICGSKMGLVTASGAAGTAADPKPKTICSKQVPFRIEFSSDDWEISGAMLESKLGTNTGFKIRYFQTTC
jgi:hypothetical protein